MIDKKELIRLYLEERLSINKLWKIYKSSNWYIRKILEDNNIEINHKNRKKYIFTVEHKRKIWEKSKWRKTRLWMKVSEEQRRKNMIWHLKTDVTIKDIEKYNNLDMLMFLNKVISRHKNNFNTKKDYIAYLDKFFFDDMFNKLYLNWINNWKGKRYRPSLEHLLPISRWWTFDLENLTFTTWFENRAKAEMTLQERYIFKKETWTNSNLFYL